LRGEFGQAGAAGYRGDVLPENSGSGDRTVRSFLSQDVVAIVRVVEECVDLGGL
jgi:hypothetical protein